MASLAPPIVPQGDPTGMQLFMRGFAMMADINRQRQAADLALRNQIEQEKRNNQAYALKKSELDLHSKLWDAQAEHYRKVRTPAATRSIEYARAVADLQREAEQRFTSYKLNDPQFQSKDPAGYAANALKWADEYQDAPSNTGLPQRISRLRKEVDQQRVVLKSGRTVPYWQIVKGLQNPETRPMTEQVLEEAGQLKKFNTEIPKRILGITYSKTQVPTKEWGPIGTKAEERSKQPIDFSKEESRVPATFPRSKTTFTGEVEEEAVVGEVTEDTDMTPPDVFPGEQNEQPDLKELARRALDDPAASAEHKAAAQRILNAQ